MSRQAPETSPLEAGHQDSDERITRLSIVVSVLLVGGALFFPVFILPIIHGIMFSNGHTALLDRAFVLWPAAQGIIFSIIGLLLLRRSALVRPVAAIGQAPGSPRVFGVILLYLGFSLISTCILQYVLYPETGIEFFALGGLLAGGPVMLLLIRAFRVQL